MEAKQMQNDRLTELIAKDNKSLEEIHEMMELSKEISLKIQH
jgi:hypothetical protein